MERAEAELIFCGKWDERRLAYRIKGRKRGVDVLTCFETSPDKIAGLERDAKISEDILRLLVLRADGVTREMLEEACAARGEERVAAPTEAETTAKKVEPEVPVAKEENKSEMALVDAVEDDGLKDQAAAEPESSIKE
jgi:ribosomal protein S6